MTKKKVLSCMQPTGNIQWGNYFGAIQNWLLLQEKHLCTYGIVDYHAMTTPYEVKHLQEATKTMLIELVATGIKIDNIFIQSLVPEHTELAWILACITSYNDLVKQVQFKEKSQNNTYITNGLFSYPVLQAADILIYKADLVPVGQDQEQHLELTKTIAKRFNYQFKCNYFSEPQALFTSLPKIFSLSDPNKKMSKNLGSKHYIGLFEDDNVVWKKIKSAVTDSANQSQESISPGVANMLSIIKACNQEEIYQKFLKNIKEKNIKYAVLKETLFEVITELTKPLKVRKKAIEEDIEPLKKKHII